MYTLLEVLYMSVVLCCGQNSRSFGKKIVMWSSVLTGHCQAQMKCDKWRRLEDFCFIPYTYCWLCPLCWWSIATGSKESTGHSLFLVAIPSSLYFGIDSHDSIGSSVLTAAKINAHMVAGVSMGGTEYSQEADFLQSCSSKEKLTSRGRIDPLGSHL